ncbi:hypothetical protein [Geminocystis sp. NIES-3709]|uniref:hypothetical protein n=1 Tax=Geminocystis sp. NIES-3709 TaxID=1617448 RepID=UPI0005FC4F5E|nr:hypothetical protein [Geminocystis sp. NIES-3709]BAQ66368.1 hypothetical protein GM3709_3133 [Geminocystis sp. NIES-3709]
MLFFPASLGLLFHSFTLNILSDQLISFAFFLFSLEQARMAVIDLKPCLFKENMENELQYSSFYIVIIVTLVIELFGFYLALFSLGWGAIFVLISQLWFNFFSPVKVIEQENIKIQNYAFSDKIIILFADVIALILMTLWLINFYPLTIAFIMLGFTMIFGIIKYSPFLLSEQ